MSYNNRLYRVYVDEMEFPIAPEEILTTPKLKNELLDIIDGEYNLIKKRGLTDFELDIRLPQRLEQPYVTAQVPMNQQYYLTYFEELIRQQMPFEFTILRPELLSSNNLDNESSVRLATLESYEIFESGENNGDIILRLKIKQYMPLAVDATEIEEDRTKGVVKERDYTVETYLDDDGKEVPGYTIIKEGDTLESLSLMSRVVVMDLIEWNGLQSEKDFYDVKPGTKFYFYPDGFMRPEEETTTDEEVSE